MCGLWASVIAAPGLGIGQHSEALTVLLRRFGSILPLGSIDLLVCFYVLHASSRIFACVFTCRVASTMSYVSIPNSLHDRLGVALSYVGHRERSVHIVSDTSCTFLV